MSPTLTDAKREARHAVIDLLTQMAHELDDGAAIMRLARHATDSQSLKSEPMLYWSDLYRRVQKFRTLALCDSPSLPYLFHGLAGTLRADVRWEVSQ